MAKVKGTGYGVPRVQTAFRMTVEGRRLLERQAARHRARSMAAWIEQLLRDQEERDRAGRQERIEGRVASLPRAAGGRS